MRRRATAVPTNFFPKDSSVPYPHDRTNQQRKAAPQGRRSNTAARGNAILPSNPTGRLVVEKGNPNVHWCPDAKKTGEYAWCCPDCGLWFHWSVDKQQWLPAVREAV